MTISLLQIEQAIDKLQSARWHVIHNTVNPGLVDGLLNEARELLKPPALQTK